MLKATRNVKAVASLNVCGHDLYAFQSLHGFQRLVVITFQYLYESKWSKHLHFWKLTWTATTYIKLIFKVDGKWIHQRFFTDGRQYRRGPFLIVHVWTFARRMTNLFFTLLGAMSGAWSVWILFGKHHSVTAITWNYDIAVGTKHSHPTHRCIRIEWSISTISRGSGHRDIIISRQCF